MASRLVTDDPFDYYDEFVPEHLPEPGPFLQGHVVLRGPDHVAVHRTVRDAFDAEGVSDVTLDYNLARLNLDSRHPDAGFRYAIERGDPQVLRVAFTPRTPFCPDAGALGTAALQALNGRRSPLEYDLVRVRVAPEHHQREEINDRLESMERTVGQTASGVSTPGRPRDGPPTPK